MSSYSQTMTSQTKLSGTSIGNPTLTLESFLALHTQKRRPSEGRVKEKRKGCLCSSNQ